MYKILFRYPFKYGYPIRTIHLILLLESILFIKIFPQIFIPLFLFNAILYAGVGFIIKADLSYNKEPDYGKLALLMNIVFNGYIILAFEMTQWLKRPKKYTESEEEFNVRQKIKIRMKKLKKLKI